MVDPVRVENAEVGAATTNTFFSNSSVTSCWLKVVDTHSYWFTVGDTLWNWALAVTSTHSNSVDYVALLPLVSKLSGADNVGWTRSTGDDGELSQVPCHDTESELDQVTLLVLVDALDVFVGTPGKLALEGVFRGVEENGRESSLVSV